MDHPEFTKSVSSHHFGPVLAIQRSPFYDDILLTVGEWTFRIWKEGINSPIFTSHSADFTLNTGCWSPTRPGLIYTAKTDGNLEVTNREPGDERVRGRETARKKKRASHYRCVLIHLLAKKGGDLEAGW